MEKKYSKEVKRGPTTLYGWGAGDAVDDSQGNLHHGGVDEPLAASFFIFCGRSLRSPVTGS